MNCYGSLISTANFKVIRGFEVGQIHGQRFRICTNIRIKLIKAYKKRLRAERDCEYGSMYFDFYLKFTGVPRRSHYPFSSD